MTRLLGQYENEAMAQLARMELEENGIHAEVVGGSLNLLIGIAATTRAVQLMVEDNDYERARALLSRESEASGDAEHE